MSNESPEFQYDAPPGAEAFFAQLSNDLNRFGANRRLLIERYYHNAPCWSLRFKHPKGGAGSIDVWQESEDSVKIFAHWWLDDIDKFARFTRAEETPEFKIDSIDLAEILNAQLLVILSWETHELTRADIDYEPLWKPYKETLLKYLDRYPNPKI